MTYSLRIELPGAPAMNTADGTHWRKRKRQKDLWIKATSIAARNAGLPSEPLRRARVRIVRRTAAPRAPDFENLAQGGKWILDGLVRCGVLEDDHQGVIGQPVYDWERAPRGRKSVVVEVEEVVK